MSVQEKTQEKLSPAHPVLLRYFNRRSSAGKQEAWGGSWSSKIYLSYIWSSSFAEWMSEWKNELHVWMNKT